MQFSTAVQQRKALQEGLSRRCVVAYIDVYYQSHASDTGATVNHENDPCPVRQAQQLELSQRATPRLKARFTYHVYSCSYSTVRFT